MQSTRHRNGREVARARVRMHARTHTPKPVCEHEDVKVLWSQELNTDRQVMANRPDIIIKNKKEKACVMIHVAIPADRNVKQKNQNTSHKTDIT